MLLCKPKNLSLVPRTQARKQGGSVSYNPSSSEGKTDSWDGSAGQPMLPTPRIRRDPIPQPNEFYQRQVYLIFSHFEVILVYKLSSMLAFRGT